MSKDTSFDAAFAELKDMQRDTNRMMKADYDRMSKRLKQPMNDRFSWREISMVSVTILLGYLLAKFVL